MNLVSRGSTTEITRESAESIDNSASHTLGPHKLPESDSISDFSTARSDNLDNDVCTTCFIYHSNFKIDIPMLC